MIQFIREFLCYLYSFIVPSNKIPGNIRHKNNFLSAAKCEEERKEMITREINAIDNSI